MPIARGDFLDRALLDHPLRPARPQAPGCREPAPSQYSFDIRKRHCGCERSTHLQIFARTGRQGASVRREVPARRISAVPGLSRVEVGRSHCSSHSNFWEKFGRSTRNCSFGSRRGRESAGDKRFFPDAIAETGFHDSVGARSGRKNSARA